MKAIRVAAYGDPGVMQLRDVDIPVPGDDEVLIEIKASAVNPIDWKIVTGAMQRFIPLPLPFTPGVDAAGVVVEVGRNVTTLRAGDEVRGFIGIVGAYATHAVVAADKLARKPASIDFDTAASIPAAALTAWQALHEHGRVQQGDKVLIHAAAGGVGSAAVQMAALAGARVIGTASARNRDHVLHLGAEDVIDYNAGDFTKQVSDADLVLDLVGGDTQDRSWSVLRRGGRMVSTVSQPDAMRAREIGGEGMRFSARSDGRLLSDIVALYEAGRLSNRIDSIFALADAGDAMRKSMTQHVRGKVVIRTAD
ncbi:Quinone oxidoreductase 1 [Cupriavidus sp. H18C1]|uniref:NADP-dependent oxidoreductase n=1 Tax=Cupriavidus sp. H18C1 TaxID=3241601 RepID=UPI003BB8F14D